MRNLGFLFLLFCTSFVLGSQADFEKANEFYENESYDSAIVVYESILDENQYSFEIYYNLGNAYFRSDKLGKAIMYWEKARKIKPSNQMVIDNLNYAYSFARDKFEVDIKSIGFLKGFIFEKSPNFWSYLSIFTAILLATTLFLFFISRNETVHQVSFYVSIIGFVCLIGFVIFASLHKSHFEESSEAIVIEPRIQVLSEPKGGSDEVFALREGTKVQIVNTDKEWLEIVVNKDNTGWVQADVLGKI